MDSLLRLKHWHLFVLLVGVPLIFQSIFIGIMLTSQNPKFMILIFPIVMIFTMGVFFGWFYTMGTNLHKKLPATVKMNLTRFKIFTVLPIIYILFLCIFMFSVFNEAVANREPPNIGMIGLIIPVHLFSMFCIFYCLYFNAKSLKAVEWQRPVTFSDFAGEFFLIWFFPIGVWIIQPRINKLFDNNNSESTNDLFS